MLISQKGCKLVRIHDCLGDCHFAKVAHAAPSNPKYSHARARLWRQTSRGGHSPGFPSSTKQPNPHVGPPRVAGASGLSTRPQRGQMEVTVQLCSMSGWSTLSVYSGCGSHMDAAICCSCLSHYPKCSASSVSEPDCTSALAGQTKHTAKSMTPLLTGYQHSKGIMLTSVC